MTCDVVCIGKVASTHTHTHVYVCLNMHYKKKRMYLQSDCIHTYMHTYIHVSCMHTRVMQGSFRVLLVEASPWNLCEWPIPWFHQSGVRVWFSRIDSRDKKCLSSKDTQTHTCMSKDRCTRLPCWEADRQTHMSSYEKTDRHTHTHHDFAECYGISLVFSEGLNEPFSESVC